MKALKEKKTKRIDPEKIRAKRIAAVVANGGTLSKAARKEGLSEAYIKSGKIQKTQVFQEAAKPFIEQLENARQSAVNRLPKKINRAGWYALVDGIHKMTHDIQLLKGRATDRLDLSFDPEEERDVEKLMKRNAK